MQALRKMFIWDPKDPCEFTYPDYDRFEDTASAGKQLKPICEIRGEGMAMEWFRNVAQQYIDPFGIVIGILVAIPIFWTWWEVTLGRKRLRSRWITQVRESPGTRPAILVVDLLTGKNIMASVERYRSSVEGLKVVPPDRIFTVAREKRLTPADMPSLVADIRSIAGKIISSGSDTVHLFYGGPVIPVALLGAEFANTCQVMLYQHTPAGYENWGPLRHLVD
jgi:hypothetical protein